MLCKVLVLALGDTDLLPNEVVDRFQFRERNEQTGALVRVTVSSDTTLGVGALVTREEFREANALAEAEGKHGAKARRPSPRRRRRCSWASPRRRSPPTPPGRPTTESTNALSLGIQELERQHIIEVLERTGWRVSGKRGAARILDIKPTTLEARMKKLGISRPLR